jgi:hypothetical protein
MPPSTTGCGLHEFHHHARVWTGSCSPRCFIFCAALQTCRQSTMFSPHPHNPVVLTEVAYTGPHNPVADTHFSIVVCCRYGGGLSGHAPGAKRESRAWHSRGRRLAHFCAAGELTTTSSQLPPQCSGAIRRAKSTVRTHTGAPVLLLNRYGLWGPSRPDPQLTTTVVLHGLVGATPVRMWMISS